jgi:hypothetical protein
MSTGRAVITPRACHDAVASWEEAGLADPPSERAVRGQVPQREISKGFQDMLGRMIADPDFRRQMADDPEQAVQRAGIQLAPPELERIRSMTADDRQRLIQETDTRDSKAWWIVIWRWVSWW